ncbi:MAG TPA: PPOX class F420-dependent oxidoreductase [Trebonia sp.]|jgi:PPOX class probable F420-dependent enzyme
MTTQTIPLSHRDLFAPPAPVTLATLGPTGYPQVTAIWAVLDGDYVVTSLAGVRQKLKNLIAHPRATVFAVDPANPFRTVEVRGDVTIEPDPGLVTLGKVLAAYGTDLASFKGPLEGRVTITLRPARVVALG